MNKPFLNNQFFGIRVPDPNKLICCIETPGGTSYVKQPTPTAAEILDHIKKLKEDLYDGPPLIKVWIGKTHLQIKPLTDYPLIQENPLLPENTVYIRAGLGVICGTYAYKRIWEIGFIAVWVEEPPD